MDSKFHYVYMLQSIDSPGHWYVGLTEDLESRIKVHNAGRVPYTSKFLPWRVETAIAFRDRAKALAFERYLKNQSGRAFARKHF